MKKFFVGLLSIFLLVGASVLSACGEQKPTLSLSRESVEIELYSGDLDSGYETVTAEVFNASDTSISVSANGYEQIVNVNAQPTTSGKTLITITGLQEGYAEVVVRTNQGNAYKTINVDVYSEVSEMAQKVEEVSKKKNFAIRGTTNTLIENNLIEFKPSQNSRRTITWTFENDTNQTIGASIDGNILTISDEYTQNEIILKATTEKGITTLINLPVIDKIEADVSFEWSYSENSEFQQIDPKQSYTIVPNVPTDDLYEGYISVNYAGELDITPVVTTKSGAQTSDVTVVRYAEYNDRPLFKVYANKDKVNINGDYIIYFEIGYKNYDYSINSLSSCPINISVREKVNGITISTDNAVDIEGSEQTIYTDYASSSEKGKEFNVSITPTTVIGATNKYSISVHRESAGEAIAEGCPIEIWYRDALNGNIWTQIPLVEDPASGDYVTTENNLPSVNKIYIKASSSLKVQSYSGISLTFTSEDNKNVSTSFNVKLVRSVSVEDFTFEDADFRVDSSKETGVTIKKTFTLKGQTSVEGLYIINNSKYVDISEPQKVSNDENSVTFEIILTLKKESYGVTSLDSYQIAHENGLVSEEFDIDIFLPLKSASVTEDTNNLSNSVTDREYSKNIYLSNGEVYDDEAPASISRLMLKNGSTTPVLYSYNTVAGQSAIANISVSYYDYSQSGLDLAAFKNLMTNPAGIAEIINKSKENEEKVSGVANFTNNNSNILTKSEGFTYAVLSFTGKGVDNVDQNGNVTLIRIILIESYVGPDGLNVTPSANKQISLYAEDTVATRDEDETKKRITINFNNSQITYYDLANFEFVSTREDSNGNPVMGEQTISGRSITWENGRYSITNISINSNSISFDVEALTTMSDHAFYDDLLVHYVLKNDSGKVVTDIYTPISITIKNAQRIESVIWENSDEDGIYFEVGTSEPYYMLLQTSPTNAKNNNMSYIITDDNGGVITNFVSVSSDYSANTLAVNLSKSINEGMSGYIYVLPEDAIYNNSVKYYYMDGDREKSGSVAVSELGLIKDSTTRQTWFEFLTKEAYFKSITSADNEKNVSFADVLLKVKVTAADGKSFDYAYRIYDVNGFVKMKADLYYTIMNSLDLTNVDRSAEEFRTSFSGGLQGYNSDITINFSGNNFTQTLTESATIRNIKFSGNVSEGNGFVVDTNNGTISNVTVDVNDRYASTLIVKSGENAGGIAGLNTSLIENCSVLGLTIDASISGSKVGGIAGQNAGTIREGIVEFYNLINKDSTGEEDKYAPNTFTGVTVGGLVGKILNNSIIEKSYVYDYNLASSDDRVLIGYSGSIEVGNFAGIVAEDADPAVTKIDYSFAVLNDGTPYSGYLNETTKVTITNSYIGYYGMEGYDVTYLPDDIQINDNYVESGEEGFLNYVNNGNAHLKDLYQDEKVSDVSSYSIKTTDTSTTNGYYKSIEVSSDKGILFNYNLEDNPNDLTSSEQNDLNELNTISLSELVGVSDISRNIIVSSSSSNILKIVGSDIIINKTGNVILTLSSKQDVSQYKEIYVKVIYAMSDVIVSWTDASGYTNIVEDDSLSYLQKTKTRDYIVGYDKTTVVLGNTAQRYDLTLNENINMTVNLSGLTESGQSLVSYQKISNEVFKFTANDSSVDTDVSLTPVVFEKQDAIEPGEDEELTEDQEIENIFRSEEYQKAINETFERNFKISPTDGVITFALSGENLPITPSTNGTVRVQIETTEKDDYIIPQIRYNNEELKIETNDNLYSYTLPKDEQTNSPIIDARVSLVSSNFDDQTGVYTYIYEVNFAVNNNYKNKISDDFVFDVSFVSHSGNDSRDNDNGNFELTITKQKFTNVDISNLRITNSYYAKDGEEYITVHETGSKTGVLAPGNSSVLQININPSFAYYDYMDISYSGATVSNAVNVELVKPYNGSDDKFVRASDSNVQTVGSALRFTPTAEEKDLGIIYFKLWINSTVNSDSTIKFTVRFYESEGEQITYVNYYLSISYLKEPTITIDGKDTAYIAKGSQANIKITVLADQTVESPIVVGDEVTGINISSLSEPVVDEIRGTKTYTATLSASVLASVAESANDTFYVQATVNRDLNGITESKTTTATAIIVDFKLDTDNIEIANSEDNQVDVWLGVPKTFDVSYNLIPEEYQYDASDEESSNIVKELNAKRNSFITKQYYPTDATEAENANYLINYIYTSDNKTPEAQTLVDRLFYVINGNELVHVNDPSVKENSPVEFKQDGDDVIVTGKTMGATVEVVLKTYISAGGLTAEYDTHFTITVDAYSDPDLPLTISNASEFKNLNPENYDEIKANDYILTNDIVLENYTPFDSSMIRSLDGNGYTIFIKNFNVEQEETSALNLALFNTVTEDTTLKNVRVNMYNGGQLTIDISTYTTINIAGIAITNKGTITNSEVVAFYCEEKKMGDVLLVDSCALHNNPVGINVKYVRGKNTTEEVYLTQNSKWTSNIAGFVLNNDGSITNSRVGGDSITIIDSEKLIDDTPTGYTYASTQELETFNIIGQGNMAGFVLSNAGAIASSFVKQLDMENKSEATSFYTSGFVGTNTNSIITSYVEGVDTPSTVPAEDRSVYAKEGSSIKSKLGYIAGFIYTNSGNIKDSYSNILISNSTDTSRVYLASGFVYINRGVLENCYSASQITNSKFTQMNFSGVDNEGNLLAEGTYINCYFFNKDYESFEDTNDTTTESQFGTGALMVTNPSDVSNFYGFAIADGENDGIWRKEAVGTITEKGETVTKYSITLIETNNISHSHRYTLYIDENSDYEGIVGENEQGKYILPYSTLQFIETGLEIDTSLGTKSNPIIVADYQDFVEVTGTSTSTNISKYYDDEMVWGTYRLVNDIDLSQLVSSDKSVVLPSTMKAFAGTIYGNGFEISGISITSDTTRVAFGLFASIEGRRGSTPIITNLDITLNQVVAGDVVMVGGLAGYIKDAIIVNIDISFNDNSKVTGLSFVGGVAGLAFGNNILKNITITNPTVTADRYSYVSEGDYLTTTSLSTFRTGLKNDLNYGASVDSITIKNMQNYSYAGSVIGYVDNYVVESTEFNINQSDTYSINNIRVSGIVNVQAQVVGGIFGLTGYQTNVRDAGITIDGNSSNNSSHIISTKYFAGGVVGQSFGSLSRVFAVHNENTQNEIENNMGYFYQGNTQMERGILDLFVIADEEYSQEYIGGIAGYVGSGKLEISYSKLNVTSTTAKYAGGLIGGMELMDTKSYQADTDMAAEPSYTKYFINEAYATGDIRGNVRAGGLIGAIKGEGSRVSLLSVNAFNYFTTYNYETQEYGNITTEGNASNNYKVNSIVGDFIDSEDNIAAGDEYPSYIVFMQAKEEVNDGGTEEGGSTGGEGGVTNVYIPSVSYYQYYEFNGFETRLNVFNGYQADNEQLSPDYLYAIASPSLYNDAQTGHTYTQEGFLNSGVWSTANWVHPSEDLFPGIRYQRSTDVLYLDYYNVKEIFEMMNGSSYTVIVRGLESENAENSYKDINLKKIEEEYGVEIPSITGFSGRIIGGQGYKDKDTNQDVKIIAENNFITSVGQGFSIEDLTILYTGTDSNIELEDDGQGNAGLLIQSAADEINISNVTLKIQKPIVANSNKFSGTSIKIGVVAPRLSSSSITNLTISASAEFGSAALLQINGMADKDEIYTGLVAGELVQSSSISIMQIEGIKIELLNSAMSINNSSSKNYYIGGYFGKTLIDANAQDLRLTITDLLATSNGEAIDTEIMLGNVTQSSGGVYLGGYIGKIEGLGVLGTFEEKTINVKLNLTINGSSKIDNLYSGLLIGQNTSKSTLSFDGQNSIFNGGLYIDKNVNVKNLKAGGIIGSNNGGEIKISEISTINYEVNNSDSQTIKKLNKNDFTTTEFGGEVEVLESAYIGVVAGETLSQFTFTGTSSTTYLNNTDKTDIRVKASEDIRVNIGSILGYLGTSVSKLDITGNITSNANFLVSGESSNVNVGGIIGNIENGASNTINIAGTGQKELVSYDGGVFSNVKGINFGGIVGGYYVTSDKSEISLNIKETSFGGIHKIFGGNSESASITSGGTIGYVNDTKSKAEIKLNSNYNYGDTFVQYSPSLSQLSVYNFGGLVGVVSSSTYCFDDGNYSIVTSHNSRYLTTTGTTGTAHALFGVGVPKGDTSNNYYNHQVALLTDDNGYDIGYYQVYSDTDFGYGDSKGVSEGIIETIKNARGISSSVLEGHKLNPIVIGDSKTSDESSFNGIEYYIFGGSFSLSDKSLDSLVDSLAEDNKNVALIGEGQQFDYKNTEATAFIDKLSGYSFVSGIVLNVSMEIDEATSDKNYAGLVSELSDQAIVYASQVKGTIEIGSYIEEAGQDEDGNQTEVNVSSNPANVSGLVGTMSGGKIFDCSTAVDITYRAEEKGNIYGIVSLSDKENDENTLNKIIENTYSTGSLTTYINTNIYAFTNGASHTKIQNSYTISKIDWNDYTKESNIPENGTVFSVFGINKDTTYELKNVYYDRNALNINISDTDIGEEITYTTEGATIYTDKELGIKKNTNDFYTKDEKGNLNIGFSNAASWTIDEKFNYNYPILKYGYLKLSSYAEVSESKAKGVDYDSYIIESTYSRLANNSSIENYSDVYYMIPNAGVLSNINEIGLDKNYILLYDIDLNYSENTIFNETKSLGDVNNITTSFTGKFDGQEKTISGLKNSLFVEIGRDNINENGTTITIEDSNYNEKVNENYVRNLRLTEASIENGNGILATNIKLATISNMTISGNLTGGKDYIGGLANELHSGFINTVTNMINLSITSKGTNSQIKVGGLVGLMDGGKIYYSSNYGPINVSINSDELANYVGGIVGSIGSMDSFDLTEYSNQTLNEIKYSYNSASVIAGFGSSTTSLDTSGRFMVAGITALNTQILTISDSYNAGMIKAGNKNNDGGSAKSSYAAGIISYGYELGNTIISNCYNEGTIEALGKNPETKFTWEGTNSGPTQSEEKQALQDPYQDFDGDLVLRQSSDRNVYAYGLGYIKTGEIKDSKIRLTVNNSAQITEADMTTIYNNGAALENGREISRWAWSSIREEMTDEINHNTTGSSSNDGYWEYAEPSVFHWVGWRSRIFVNIYLQNPTAGTEVQTTGDNPELKITSYDQLGLPSSFIINKNVQIKCLFEGQYRPNYTIFTSWEDKNYDHTIDVDESTTILNQTYFKYFSETNIYGQYNDTSLNNEIVVSSEQSELKNKCRSNEAASIDKLPVKIADQEYRFVDENNQNTIFNAGVYSTSGSFTSSLPYINNPSYYTLSAKVLTSQGNETNQEISTIINSIQKGNSNEEGNTIINYTITSTKPLEGKLQLKLTLNYEEKLTFDLSQFDYVYIDDNSFGIYMSQLNSKIQSWILSGYTINGMSVIRLSNKNYAYDPKDTNIKDNDNAPDNPEDSSYIYLAYDVNNPNILIFVPNATLQDSTSADSYQVNNVDNFAEGTSLSDNFNKNVQKLIRDQFSGKTYYIRYRDNSSVDYTEIEFSNKGSGSDSLNKPSTSGNETLNLGGTIKPNQIDIKSDDFIEYNNSFYITLDNKSIKMNDNELGYKILHNKDGEKFIIANYSYTALSSDAGTWDLNGSETDQYSIKIGENIYPFTLNIEDNYLKFSFSGINTNTENLNQIKEEIENYILTNFVVETNPIDESKGEKLNSYVDVDISNNVINIVNAEHKYTIDLGNLGQDVIIRYNNEILFSFDSDTNKYGMNNLKTSIIIDNYSFNISIVDNKIILTNTSKLEDIPVSIYDFFNSSLEYLVNDFSDSVENINYLSTDIINDKFVIKSSNSNLAEIIYSYQYTNFDWKVNNSSIQVTKNGNSATISFSSNYSNLNSYKFTLNDVEVYYGKVSVRVTQTASIYVTSLQLKNLQDVGTIINVKILDYDTGYTGVSASTSTTLYPNRVFESSINFNATVYATYTLGSDDLNNLNVVLEKNGEIYNLSADIEKTNENKINNVNLNSVEQLVNAKEDSAVWGHYDDIKLFIEQSKSEDKDENGNTIIRYTFSDDQDTFLVVEKSGNSTLYYLYYDDTDAIEEVEGVSSLPDKIYLSPISGAIDHDRYITKEEFNKIKIYDDFENLVKGVGSSYYIYINDNSYNFRGSYSIEDGETIESQISLATYNWKANTFDEYNEITKSLSINFSDDDMKDFEISISSTTNPFIYYRDGSRFTIILNSSSHYASGYFKVKFKMPEDIEDVVQEIGAEGKNKIEALTIVLTNDISFTNVSNTNGFTMTENINIIGNNYYLSYYGSSLLHEVTGDSYIKDINLLGEVYNSSLIISGNIKSFKLNDSSVYGSVINYVTTNNNGTLINVNNEENSSINLRNTNIYTNINNSRPKEEGINDIYLFNSNLNIADNLIFYGVVKALDGYSGIYKDLDEKYDGEDGDSGGSIYLTTSNKPELSIECNGILITGYGGNARGGKSSAKGVDLSFETTTAQVTRSDSVIKNMQSGVAGASAQGGLQGNIIGFSGNLDSHSQNGYNSLSGARGRHGFGAISYFIAHGRNGVEWDGEGNENFICFTSFNEEIDEGNDNNKYKKFKQTGIVNDKNEVLDLFNQMYKLEGSYKDDDNDINYQQTLPTGKLERRK